MDINSFHKGFNGECCTIIEKNKSKRDFIKYVAKATKIIPAKTHKDIFIKLEELIKNKSKARRFIHAYIDDFDSIQHYQGVSGKNTGMLFVDIDKQIKVLSEQIK